MRRKIDVRNVIPEDLYRDALSGKISRRSLIRRGTVLGLSLPGIAGLLAACGGDDDDSEATTSSDLTGGSTATVAATATESAGSASPASSTETSGSQTGGSGPSGSVTIAQGNDLDTLDPHQTATTNTDQSVISHLYTSLIIRNPDLELVPALAETWEATSDTTWEFKLRDDIEFPNGEKLDANTVKWNVDRVLNPDTNARIRSWFNLVDECRAVDDTTVEFVTSEPYPALADQLSMFFLLAPEWAAEHNPASEAMGTGPYELVEWIKDDHLTIKAKAEYWGDPVSFETVTFRAVPEASSRVSGLLAGDFQVLTTVPPDDFPRINDSGDATAGSLASTRTAMVNINCEVAPFDDPKVRQALNYAVNKEAIAEALFSGLNVEPSQGQILTPAYFGFNPDLEPYPYDPDMARQLLEEAGVQDGTEVEFTVPIGRYLLGQEITQVIAGQLQEVGFNVTITEIPFSVFLDKLITEHSMSPLAYITYAWPTLDADGLLSLLQKGNQYSYWPNQEYSDLLDEARSTTDPDTRRDLYAQATAIMREDAGVIFLFPQPFTYATVNSIEWDVRPDDWVRAFEMRQKG